MDQGAWPEPVDALQDDYPWASLKVRCLWWQPSRKKRLQWEESLGCPTLLDHKRSATEGSTHVRETGYVEILLGPPKGNTTLQESATWHTEDLEGHPVMAVK